MGKIRGGGRWSTAVLIGTGLTFFLIVTASGPGAQAAASGADAARAALEVSCRELAGLTLKGEGLDAIYEQGASVAAVMAASALRTGSGRELTARELVVIRNAVEKALREAVTRERLEEALGRVYMKYFDREEAEEMVRFYGSPAGAKLLKVQAQLLKELAEAGGEAIKSHEEIFIKAFLAEFLAGQWSGGKGLTAQGPDE